MIGDHPGRDLDESTPKLQRRSSESSESHSPLAQAGGSSGITEQPYRLERGRSLISQRYLDAVRRRQDEDQQMVLARRDKFITNLTQSFQPPSDLTTSNPTVSSRAPVLKKGCGERNDRTESASDVKIPTVHSGSPKVTDFDASPQRPSPSSSPRRAPPVAPARSEVTREPLPSSPSSKRPGFVPTSDPQTYDWSRARMLLTYNRSNGGYVQDLADFTLNGVPSRDWHFEGIKTLGAGKSSGRTHRLFKAKVSKHKRAFLKLIPFDKWVEQFKLMDEFRGEWVTDGENFVMEAAILALLTERRCDIIPELFCIGHVFAHPKKELDDTEICRPKSSLHRKRRANPSYIAIVSECFGQDLHSKLVKYRSKYTAKMNDATKGDATKSEIAKAKAMKVVARQREVIMNCAHLLQRYHDEGFCHLDFTAENILVGPDPQHPTLTKWKLCDFGKSTVRRTRFLRHVPNPLTNEKEVAYFESCEPTIGKSFYIPPECTRILAMLDAEHIYVPCQTYAHKIFQIARYGGDMERNRAQREKFYFRADKADIYQLMVLCLVITNFGQSAANKKIFPQAKSGAPIFDETILKKLKRLVPNNTIWDPTFIELISRNTTADPEARQRLDEIIDQLYNTFKAIKNREKKRKLRP